MGNVVIDMSMSLDGYIAAPNDTPEQGLGEAPQLSIDIIHELLPASSSIITHKGNAALTRERPDERTILRRRLGGPAGERCQPFLAPLGHAISPDGPAGLIAGIAAPAPSPASAPAQDRDARARRQHGRRPGRFERQGDLQAGIGRIAG